MLAYIAHRLIQGVVVVAGVSFIVFALMHLTPGNPAEMMLSEFGASAADLKRLEQQLGLDQPWPAQYRDFLLGCGAGRSRAVALLQARGHRAGAHRAPADAPAHW